MNEEMMLRIIRYLEPMQAYVKLMRTYYQRSDMDDFDKGYVDFYADFEDLVHKHLQNPTSPLMTLMKHYQEIIVEYEDSILYRCLEALKHGYDKQHFFNEGKKAVYLQYLSEKYNFDARDFLETMTAEEFIAFEKHIFKDFDLKTLKKSSS